MLVTERMRSLGDHAKSSRQPPVKERKYAKADESAAKQDTIDETNLEDGIARESAASVLVAEVTPQIAIRESSNDGTVATPVEGATQADAGQEDADMSATKRAIIHEWENWSALHSDELDDPNVAEYFFRHLQAKKAGLLNFGSQDKLAMVRIVLKST